MAKPTLLGVYRILRLNNKGPSRLQDAMRQRTNFYSWSFLPRRLEDDSFSYLNDVRLAIGEIRSAGVHPITRVTGLDITVEGWDSVVPTYRTPTTPSVDAALSISASTWLAGEEGRYRNWLCFAKLPTQRFFDQVKIDKSFSKDIEHNTGSVAIVRAILGVAGKLGMTVTAEGVETEEELIVVMAEAYSLVQGYFFSLPLAANAMQAYLQNPVAWVSRLLTNDAQYICCGLAV